MDVSSADEMVEWYKTMMDKDLKRGWVCPCCQTIHSPDTTSCMWCSPVAVMMMKVMDPEVFSKFEPYHDCPRVRAATAVERKS